MITVMAHGCFELLHAGHVAHLEQAKAMGEYLIVGITADDYVQKGAGRPAVCAEDRARAVRALRCVDEVIIDPHSTPEAMITARKPSIFVKGADYAGQTIPEQKWVARYGGRVAFTTGETMYHSRQFIHGDVRGQLEAAGLRVDDLIGILDSAAAYRIHVVGDLILDTYHDGEMIGPLTLQVHRQEHWSGGAEAVAHHARGAGAVGQLSHVGNVARKARYYADTGLVCQIDHVDSTPIDGETTRRLAGRVRDTAADAVIFADYRHGVFHPGSIEILRAAIPNFALAVADSQVASRWGNIMDFKGFNLVTPNEREARWATGMQDAPPWEVAHRLGEVFPSVLMTRGADGLVGVNPLGTPFTVPALATQVVDPVGAGDALLAYATLGLLARNSLVAAAWLGSVAAAIACSRRGNPPVTAAEVRAWLEAL